LRRISAERAFRTSRVDEAKKALFSNAKLKSFDFVVYSKNGPNLLIDVKGRSMRTTETGKAGSFQTWATQQDVDDLIQWQQVFGDGFKSGAAVHLLDRRAADPRAGDVRVRRPLVFIDEAVDLEAYRTHMRQRSSQVGDRRIARRRLSARLPGR